MERAEEKFLVQKTAKGGATMKQKLTNRAMRQNWRENWRTPAPGTSVQPDTVDSGAEVAEAEAN